MRPKRYTYTLAATSVAGYLSNATGATWTLSATTAADGLAHPVTIKGDAATDHSGKTAVITGTDAEGRALTETVALPNGTATVTSTKLFKTVTTVVPSATIGADTMDIGWTAVAATPLYQINSLAMNGAGILVDIGGTVTYTVQQTTDNVQNQNPPAWVTLGTASLTADSVNYASAGCTALRVSVASHTAGTLAISLAQSA